jgi:hypothetical protein
MYAYTQQSHNIISNLDKSITADVPRVERKGGKSRRACSERQ